MVEPQPGDFGLCRITGVVGFLIRACQWLNGDGFSRMEHAFVYLGGGRIVEAAPGGAVEVDVAEYADRPIVWSTGRIPLTGDQRAAIVAAARGFVGVPYSFVDYLAILAHRLRLPIPGLRDYVASSGHQICSQLVDRAYERAGVHLFTDGRWDGYVVPAGLARLLRAPAS